MSTTHSHVVSKRHVLSRDIKSMFCTVCPHSVSAKAWLFQHPVYTVDHPTLHALHHADMTAFHLRYRGKSPFKHKSFKLQSNTYRHGHLSPIYGKYTIVDGHDVIL